MRTSIVSRYGFQNLFRDLSDTIDSNGNETRLTLSHRYGKGSIRFINISDHVSIAVTDLCLHDGLEISYEMPADHFEIGCCVDDTILQYYLQYSHISNKY